MKKQCPLCNKAFQGRSDKRFCSLACKNQYNNNVRRDILENIQPIDQHLHRNHAILQQLLRRDKEASGIFDRLLLESLGFDFDHVTGICFNPENKLQHLVYDVAWVDIEEQKIWVERQEQTRLRVNA